MSELDERRIEELRRAAKFAADIDGDVELRPTSANALLAEIDAITAALTQALAERDGLREALEPAMPMLRSLWPKVAAALATAPNTKDGEG